MWIIVFKIITTSFLSIPKWSQSYSETVIFLCKIKFHEMIHKCSRYRSQIVFFMSPERDFRERSKNYKMLPRKIKFEKKGLFYKLEQLFRFKRKC